MGEMTKRDEWVSWALSFYAVTSLVSMAVMNLGAAVFVVVLVVAAGGPAGLWRELISDSKRRWVRRMLVASSVLVCACLASLVAATFFPLGYGGRFVRVAYLKDLAKIWYLFWPFLLYVAMSRLSEGGRRRVLRTWVGAFAVLAMIGIAQYFTGWPRPQPIPGHDSRYHVTLFLGHHLSVASILIFPLFVTIEWGVREWRARGPWLCSIAALGVVAILLTYSRMVWVALPVGLAVYALWSLPRKWSIAVVVALTLAAAGLSQLDAVKHRLFDPLGVGTRQELWQANLEFFRARPLTGAGWHHNLDLAGYYLEAKYGDGRHFVGHAHNNGIEMLGGTGALGLLAWLVWCVLPVWMMIRASRGTQRGFFPRALACAWLVFHLNGLTQVNFWESKVLHQISFVTALGMLWVQSQEERIAGIEQTKRNA